MILRAGFVALAQKLQEAAGDLSCDDVATRLRDAVQDNFRGTGAWGYFICYFGDADTGQVIYSADGNICRAPYVIGKGDGQAGAKVDFTKVENVVPKTTYEVEGDGTSTTESGVSRETQHVSSTEPLNLVESAASTEAIVLREAKADYEIKLIAPGKGSTAFYPQEVLKRDGPQVFKAGTHVYLNHPTLAEEAARPEGDVKNLAGVLTTDAVYHEAHAKGPGLYGRMKVFADHAQLVEEKAPHVGMSIRAHGVREDGGKTRDGVPVLKALTSAESVDVVTRAGAGGMILQESAKGAEITNKGAEVDMTEVEVKKLIEAATTPLRARAVRGDASVVANRVLAGIDLPPNAKNRVIESTLSALPISEAGELDETKYRDLVLAEAKREAEYVQSLGVGRVFGMGESAAPLRESLTAEQITARETAAKREEEDAVRVFESLGMPKEAAQFSAAGRAN